MADGRCQMANGRRAPPSINHLPLAMWHPESLVPGPSMLDALIGFSLKNRFFVLLATGLLIAFGVQAARTLPLDAFPDTTPVQVQINTIAPAMGPEEMERLVTFPIEYALGGLKGLQEVRSISKPGLSQVVVIFSDDTDIYF